MPRQVTEENKTKIDHKTRQNRSIKKLIQSKKILTSDCSESKIPPRSRSASSPPPSLQQIKNQSIRSANYKTNQDIGTQQDSILKNVVDKKR